MSEVTDFIEFAESVGLGLAKAVATDADVFLLASTGVLLGCRNRRLKAMGIALGAYTTFRRIDRYVDVIHTDVYGIRRVMASQLAMKD